MLKKRGWLVLVLLALTAGLLAACGGAGVEEGEEGGSPVVELDPFPPAELVFYSTNGDTEEAFNSKFGDLIRQNFPHHTIQFIQFKEGSRYPDIIASGQQVDLIFESIAQWTSGPLYHGAIMDMEPLIRRHHVDLNRLEQTALQAMKDMTGGYLAGLPAYSNSLALYYNKDMFDQAGVDYPVAGMTWDEVLELNRRMTRVQDGEQLVGLALATAHIFRMNNLSLPYVTADHKSALNQNLDKWSALYNTVFVGPTQASGYREFVEATGIPGPNHFFQHRAAMLAGLTNIPTTQAGMKEVNWEVVTFPTFKEAPGVLAQFYPSYFGVSGMSRNQDQAMEIIQYLLGDEFQTQWARNGNMPAVHSPEILNQFAADTEFKDKNVVNAFFGSYAPIPSRTMYDGQVESIFTRHIRALMQGTMDFNTMMRTNHEDLELRLEQLKAQ